MAAAVISQLSAGPAPMGTSLAFHLTFAISGVSRADDPCIRTAWPRERARSRSEGLRPSAGPARARRSRPCVLAQTFGPVSCMAP
jgi:hypothetical protein